MTHSLYTPIFNGESETSRFNNTVDWDEPMKVQRHSVVRPGVYSRLGGFRLTLLILLGVVAALWLLFAPRVWSEDVKLSDGNVIEVYRLGVHWRVGEPGHGGQLVAEWALFNFASRWYLWSGDLDVVLIDVYETTPYLVGIAGNTVSCARYQDATPFVFFRYANGWQRIEPKEFPDKIETNLLLSSYSNHQWRYSAEEKRVLDRSPKMDIYFNRPIKSVAFGC